MVECKCEFNPRHCGYNVHVHIQCVCIPYFLTCTRTCTYIFVSLANYLGLTQSSIQTHVHVCMRTCPYSVLYTCMLMLYMLMLCVDVMTLCVFLLYLCANLPGPHDLPYKYVYTHATVDNHIRMAVYISLYQLQWASCMVEVWPLWLVPHQLVVDVT